MLFFILPSNFLVTIKKNTIKNIPTFVVIGKTISSLFYKIFYQKDSKTISNNKENKNKNKEHNRDRCTIAENEKKKKEEIKRINIFIHGSSSGAEEYTRPSGPKPSFTGLCRNIKEQFNTEKEVEKLYKDKIRFAENKKRKYLFGKNLFPLLAGLVPGLDQINQHSVTQTAFNFIYKPFIKNQESHDELSFIFNWDGDLSEISRKFAGEKLREAIISLNNNYAMAEIYCYAHSHGGNVLLHSMQKNSTENEEKYKIKIGYLFGTPIGEKTENLINNIVQKPYEKIFNIFSYADYVQTGDVTFSWGKLPKRIIKTKDKDIKNIELVIDKKSTVAHQDFFLYQKNKNNNSALVRFFHDFDQIIKQEANEENSRYSLNTSTGTFTAID